MGAMYTYTMTGTNNFGLINVFQMLNDIYGWRGYVQRLRDEMKTITNANTRSRKLDRYMSNLWRGDDNSRKWHEHQQRGGHMLALSSLFRCVPVEVLSSVAEHGFEPLGALTHKYVKVDLDEENDSITLTVVCENLQAALDKGGA